MCKFIVCSICLDAKSPLLPFFFRLFVSLLLLDPKFVILANFDGTRQLGRKNLDRVLAPDADRISMRLCVLSSGCFRLLLDSLLP